MSFVAALAVKSVINNNINWQEKMVKTISQNYSGSSNFNNIEFILDIIKNYKTNNLSDLNIFLIK